MCSSKHKFDNHNNNYYARLLVMVFIMFSCISVAFSQRTTKIEILNANTIEFDKSTGINANRLIGDVVFSHEGSIMHCDSAYYYTDENIVDAYHNIHIVQGDTLHLYGDFLKYTGNTKLAEVRENVVLIDKETHLTTNYLDFDLNADLAYYIGGGKIINGKNTLTSKVGHYYSKEKLFFFKDDVVIINPDYTIYSDTLRYNTVTETAYFLGPTEIISDKNYIYCENGWYDTERDISQFNKNAFLRDDEKILKGDSLYYERANGFGQAFRNVELIDSVQNIILKGHFANYYENPERALLTNEAQLILITENDSMFVHADTLRQVMDSTGIHKMLKAYYRVKMFKSDIQSKSDSMTYSYADSVFRLYDGPVIWSDENQLTADYMEIYTKNNNVDYIYLENSAFIVSQEDTVKFNQVKGRTMTGYFKDNELYKIFVNGSGQTLYFPKDEDELIGMNKAESSNLIIFLKDNKIDRINFLTRPVARLVPLDQVHENDMLLKDFRWLEKHRPMSKNDIFIWVTE